MADEQIIIEVQLDAQGIEKQLDSVARRVADLKLRQQELNDQYKVGAVNSDYYVKQQKILAQELSTATREQTNLTNALRLANAETDTYSDSLDGMRAKLRDMQSAYAGLSAEQRDTSAGKAFLKSIAEQDKAVKSLEKSIGDARRNVGNYADAINESIPSLGRFSSAIKAFPEMLTAISKGGVAAFKGIAQAIGAATKAALAFLATPIGMIIAGIAAAVGVLVGAFKALAAGFKKSDDAGTSLAKFFAAFQPIVDGFNRLMVKAAEGIGKLFEAIGRLIGRFSDASKVAQDLVDAQDKLEESEREYVTNSAERAKEIARLRNQAKERDKYTAEERKNFILQAIKLEEDELNERKKNAKERLRILEATAKKESDTTDETKDKIAKARADVLLIEADYYNKTRELLEQKATAEREYQKEIEDARQKEFEDYEKNLLKKQEALQLHLEALEALLNAEEARENSRRELREKYNLVTDQELYDEELAVLKDALDRRLLTQEEYFKATDQLLAKYAPKEIAEEEEEEDIITVKPRAEREAEERKTTEDMVRETFGLDKEALEYYNELIDSGIESTKALGMTQEFIAKRNVQLFAESATSMADSFNEMAEFLNKYGEENKKAQKAQKAFTLASIFASQAQSIAEGALAISAGIAQSQSVPFPANIAAIATTVGTITSLISSTAASFMQAKELVKGILDAGNFATGGIVGGTSYAGDRVTAHVNSREMILTTEQQKTLFDIANSRVNVGFDYAALAAAISAQPAPVMNYREFKQFEQKVSTYNEIAKV